MAVWDTYNTVDSEYFVWLCGLEPQMHLRNVLRLRHGEIIKPHARKNSPGAKSQC